MKKLSVLITAMLLMNTFPVFAAEADTAEVFEAEVISAELTPEEEVTAEAVLPPESITDIPVVIDGTSRAFQNPVMLKNGIMLVPFEETTKAFWLSYNFTDGVHKAYSPIRSLSVDSLNNAYIFNVLQLPEATPEIINGALYVPASLFVKAFNLDIIINTEGEKPVLYLATSGTENARLNEGYINSTGLGSDTPYMIWISKSDYKVRVFLGESGKWTQINSFLCGIGAPSTPTCEGTYKYYQSQAMWDYGSYYVGPIMRFNGGYAIHSTLIYKNGTPKDDRVGIKLSLGCIRLRPENINWLSYYVPLGTTIHITG